MLTVAEKSQPLRDINPRPHMHDNEDLRGPLERVFCLTCAGQRSTFSPWLTK
jgi:hypothetical protein